MLTKENGLIKDEPTSVMQQNNISPGASGLPKSPTSVAVNIAALAITVAVYLSIRMAASICERSERERA